MLPQPGFVVLRRVMRSSISGLSKSQMGASGMFLADTEPKRNAVGVAQMLSVPLNY
jgi:hypothetical protein